MLVAFLRVCRGCDHMLVRFIITYLGVLDSTLCGQVCQWPVSSTDKTDCHYITEILLKVALSTIKPINCIFYTMTTCFSFIYSYTVIITRITEVYS